MDQDKVDFQPVKVLKIYRQSYKSQYYIEIHDVRTDRSIGTGRPLTKKMFRELVSAANIKDTASYFGKPLLSTKLLSVEPINFKRHIIWYDESKNRKLIFSDGMKIKDGYYRMPAIIYFLHLGKLRVFAFKNGRSRPTLQTKLYYPPLFNTVGDFQFCWGSVDTRAKEPLLIEAEMQQWENNLWESKWSHSHAINEKLLKATNHGKKPFNSRKLVTAGMTLGQAMGKYL